MPNSAIIEITEAQVQVVELGEVIGLETEPVVEIIEVGVIGPQGPEGPQGPPAVVPQYLHIQSTSATEWTINHNLGFRPSVELLDSGGQEIEAEVSHQSINQVIVTLTIPTSGLARLN